MKAPKLSIFMKSTPEVHPSTLVWHKLQKIDVCHSIIQLVDSISDVILTKFAIKDWLLVLNYLVFNFQILINLAAAVSINKRRYTLFHVRDASSTPTWRHHFCLPHPLHTVTNFHHTQWTKVIEERQWRFWVTLKRYTVMKTTVRVTFSRCLLLYFQCC